MRTCLSEKINSYLILSWIVGVCWCDVIVGVCWMWVIAGVVVVVVVVGGCGNVVFVIVALVV